ncbi:glycosyltransferase family 2 protein [Virgibacillus pantothenticus]|uniref:Glycosyl transferase n=1 Tax=Virgibacillus pantothenticus TaxID=1473 RepID=A0A0L0QJP2_VIRPA|nr:glycosyltransferase family 2 protein [Virgibacillus pantothenticus]KNE18792.1 glycosyl transferase [Virgibacillus pantothenticus]MED3736769.1 glycosyltransferase family 2 protein [Virgibacillus pantothenticus]QTY15217.1 glycosyltransferase family 2 protein [Virgibacillus pantothenticus]SIT05556.1 Glycosyltransferase, catalytic subunit of cellulose synthase and poly-beta-1,6-N-acetylglucosamine synthase [Virgibacillus pantothenticus]
MEFFLKAIFFLSAFIIFWGMIGYPLSIKILGRVIKKKKIIKDYSYEPTVTVMVVAHNEEKVIKTKLDNLLEINYPKDRIKFLIASDNSSDRTNDIVRDFINKHTDIDIRLYEVKERMGKTNAQNEAQKTVRTDYLVMTDANSMLDKDSVKELMATFTSEDIAYVSGKLVISNDSVNDVSNSEASYWDSDLEIREIEGRIQSITAGNGAIYACRNESYYDFNPINSHDASMPLHYALNNKRAICNHDAIAYEKAGETIEDEFSRKVRMNRVILKAILPDLRLLNIIKYKWFSYFYFGHRTCRYLLWISHLFLLISNVFLIEESLFYLLIFIGQITFYILALIKAFTKINNKYLNLIYYYCITILAQWVGVYNIFTGKAKPFWEKAESTR